MSHDGDAVDDANSSAPDLQILGDEITLQPSGFVEPKGIVHDEKEEALMNQSPRFRSEPLQCVFAEACRLLLSLLLIPLATGFFAKSPSMCLAKDGELTTASSASRCFTPASRRT